MAIKTKFHIYDTTIPLHKRISMFNDEYGSFLEVALNTEENAPEIVKKISATGRKIGDEAAKSLIFYQRQNDFAEKYGLNEFRLLVYDITFFTTGKTWVSGLRAGLEKTDKESASAGMILKDVFLGNQESFPMAILANGDKRDFHEEMHFIYALINGIKLSYDQPLVNELHSLHCDVNQGKREWYEGIYSVRDVGSEYMRQNRLNSPVHKQEWERGIRALETLDEIGKECGYGIKLAEYALLACNSLDDLFGIALQVTSYKKPEEMYGELRAVVLAKISGNAKRVGSAYSAILRDSFDSPLLDEKRYEHLCANP